MLITVRKKGFLKIAEVYFAGELTEDIPGVDVIAYVQTSEFQTGCKEYHTLWIELDKDEEEIFSAMKKTTRQMIRKISKSEDIKFCFERDPTEKTLREFSQFYDEFARQKGIRRCNCQKLAALRQYNGLATASIKDKDNNILCYSANIVDGKRARGLYSASHFRAYTDGSKRDYLSMANRYLCWMEIKTFKQLGYKILDMGGLTLDKGNQEMTNIDRFKLGFGGKVVTEYNCYFAKTGRGKLALWLNKYLQ